MINVSSIFFSLFSSCNVYYQLCSVFSLGPQKKVISVYNDNFTTPCNRTPYFIEVYRCVEAGEYECFGEFIVQANQTKIEIVVPDTGDKTKFYSYVIYNHTSCTCGKENDRKEREPETKNGTTNFTTGWFVRHIKLYRYNIRGASVMNLITK